MNYSLCVIGLVAAGTFGWARDVPSTNPHRDVTVCIDRALDFPMNAGADIAWVPKALRIAESMFATAGVRVHWHTTRHCPADAIIVDVTSASQTEKKNLLGYALPYERIHLTIFGDRVQASIERSRVPNLLAHVLVHEIVHLLQRISHHSSTGVMKAVWNEQDRLQMGIKALPFTQDDVGLIRTGIDQRERALAASR